MDNVLNIVVYFTSLLMSLVFINYANKFYSNKSKIPIHAILFLSLVLTLIVGLRAENVGVDTEAYFEYYLNYFNLNNNLFSIILYEPAFNLLTILTKSLGLGVNGFLSICAIATFVPIIKYYDNDLTKLKWFVFYFYCSGYLFMMMNGVRQLIAIGLLFYSFQYLIKKDFIKYCTIIVLAAMFHYSAIILIFLYLINYINIRREGVLLLLLIISVFLNPLDYLGQFYKIGMGIFPKNYLLYLDPDFATGSKLTLGFLYHNLIALFILYHLRVFKSDKKYYLFFIAFYIGVLFTNLTYQSLSLQRFSIYFLFFQFPVLSYLSIYLINKKYYLNIAVLISLYLIQFVYKIIIKDSGIDIYKLSLDIL